MNRREFLKVSSLAAAAAALDGCRSFGGSGFAVNGIKVGVQMWSVNDLWKKEPVDAFRRLKALGYDGVQSFGFLAMDWNELGKMLDGEGLQIVDMPFYMKNLKPGEFERFVDFCQRFGIDFVYEPYNKFKTGADWRAHAQELVGVKEKFARYGIRVGYHNHQHEVKERYDGKSPLQYLYDAGLDMELDVGHVKLAGGDPLEWLGKLKGRVPSIHAKPGGGNSVGGAGDKNDWPAIFAAAAAAGTKWAIVECEARRNTYADVEASAAFIKGLKVES